MTERKLDSCPFCLAEGDGDLKGALLISCEVDQTKPHVLCTDCFARGPYGNSVDEAVALWNDRPALLAVRRAALEEAALVADEEAGREIFQDTRGFCRAASKHIATRIRAKESTHE